MEVLIKKQPMFAPLLNLARTESGTYLAPRSPEVANSMFGGQFLAQCIAAATDTVDRDRAIHSLHAYFLRPGDSEEPCELSVATIRDGRSFSHREISAFQDGKELFRMFGSWNIAESSPEFQGDRMPEVPPPDEVTYTYYQFCQDQMPDKDYLATITQRPIDIRYINPPQDRKNRSELENQLMWIRISDELPDEPWRHQAALAYISDSTLIDHITLPHGMRWMDQDFFGTSLDHTMWFHRPCKATDWVLFDQKVEWTGAGRGLASAKIWSQKGELLATCGQEGLMRF